MCELPEEGQWVQVEMLKNERKKKRIRQGNNRLKNMRLKEKYTKICWRKRSKQNSDLCKYFNHFLYLKLSNSMETNH